jgi:uncharacterized membrane protein
VNDPGTAIDVLGRVVRLLSDGVATAKEAKAEEPFANVHVPTIAVSDLFDDVFTPIARDGAGNIEVGIRLQKALHSVARLDYDGFRENALRHARLALKRANAALSLPEDKEALAEAVRRTLGHTDEQGVA